MPAPREELSTAAELLAAAEELAAPRGTPDPRDLLAALAEVPALEPLAARLGLEVADLQALAGGSLPLPRNHRTSQGFTLLLADWRTFLHGTLGRLLDALERGCPVLLVADEHVPEVSLAVQQAWHAAGGRGDVLVRVPPTRGEVLTHLLAHRRLGTLVATGDRTAIRDLRRRTDGAAFEVELEVLRARVFEVRAGEPPAEAGRRLAREAFGRLPGLGGVLPERVTRAWIPETAFSAVTDALLGCLDGEPPELRPAVCPDPRVRRAWLAAREEGLDEGAALLTPGTEAGGRLGPLVFTNVEPHMALAGALDPLPLLALLRERTAGRAAPAATLPGSPGAE